MTETASTRTNRLATIRRYRRLMFGALAGGVVVGLLLRLADYPLLGEAVYWLGIAGFLGIWWTSPVTLFDERDVAQERRASQLTLYLAAPVFVVAAALARVLPRVSDVTVPPEVVGALYAMVALYATFGAVFLWLRYRP